MRLLGKMRRLARVVSLAATAHPRGGQEAIDEALRRTGRKNGVVQVPKREAFAEGAFFDRSACVGPVLEQHEHEDGGILHD
jgi:SpoVK/Ycf46/Vps4 family AAA+-type ATPase